MATMSQSVKKRVVARSIAGTVEEFDELAAALVDRCEVADATRWELRHPAVDGFTTTEPLADVKGLDIARSRALTLWVGKPFAVRRITLTADLFGVRVDVWGENTDWVHDSAAIVKRRIRAMRPWWAFLRTGFGAGLLCLTLVALLIFGAAMFYRVAGVEFWPGTYWVATVIAVIGGVLLSTFGAPALRIGPRERLERVVVRLSVALVGAVISGVIGVALAWALTGQPAS
jgi:hypothetical protein